MTDATRTLLLYPSIHLWFCAFLEHLGFVVVVDWIAGPHSRSTLLLCVHGVTVRVVVM